MLDSASKFGNIASYFERAKEKYCPDLGFGFSQVVKLGGGWMVSLGQGRRPGKAQATDDILGSDCLAGQLTHG